MLTCWPFGLYSRMDLNTLSARCSHSRRRPETDSSPSTATSPSRWQLHVDREPVRGACPRRHRPAVPLDDLAHDRAPAPRPAAVARLGIAGAAVEALAHVRQPVGAEP